MKKKIIVHGILAIALVFAMTVVGCNDEDDVKEEPVYTPITQIPDNYLNTTWRIPGDIYVRIGSDASKFVFDQVGNVYGKADTYDKLTPVTKEEIRSGFDSGLRASKGNGGVICFMNDGSKLSWLGSTYTKQ
jgi:hypothetical protein